MRVSLLLMLVVAAMSSNVIDSSEWIDQSDAAAQIPITQHTA